MQAGGNYSCGNSTKDAEVEQPIGVELLINYETLSILRPCRRCVLRAVQLGLTVARGSVRSHSSGEATQRPARGRDADVVEVKVENGLLGCMTRVVDGAGVEFSGARRVLQQWLVAARPAS